MTSRKGSMHRFWIVLSIFNHYKEPLTLLNLIDITGLPRSTLIRILDVLTDQAEIPGLKMKRKNLEYEVTEWGNFINQNELELYYIENVDGREVKW